VSATLWLAGTALRRERVMLPIWIGAITLIVVAAATAVSTEFGDEQERAAVILVATTSPAFLFMRGLPDGVSVGAVTSFQTFAFATVFAGLMTGFLVARHTRADEQLGRAELVAASPAGRLRPLGVTLGLAIAANAALALLLFAALSAVGLPVGGSLLFGLAVGSVGVFFGGVSAVGAQLLPTARFVNGATGALIAAAFIVRGIGDALGRASIEQLRVDPLWLSLLSPIGWGAAVRPYTDAAAAPALVPVAAGALLMVLALALRSRRDLAASLLADRRGAARGGRSLRSTLRLALREAAPATLWWAVATAGLGLLAAVLSPMLADVVSANETLTELIRALVPGSSASVGDVFAASILGIGGVLAAAAGIQSLLRLRSDEAEGRLELLLGHPVGYVRLLGERLVVAAVVTVLVAAAAGLGASVTAPSLLLTGLAHAPAALATVALAGLLVVALARVASAMAWGALAAFLVIGQFGDLLQLPEWLQGISPFSHSAAVPVEPVDPVAMGLLLGVAALIALAALLAARWRELASD
jgi:ABC-2 type transport system permease protein